MNRKATAVFVLLLFLLVVVYLIASYAFFSRIVESRKLLLLAEDAASLRDESTHLTRFLARQSSALEKLGRMHESFFGMRSLADRKAKVASFLELTHSDLYVELDENGLCVFSSPESFAEMLSGANVYGETLKEALAAWKRGERVSEPLKVPCVENEVEGTCFIFAFAPIVGEDGKISGISALGFSVERIFRDYYGAMLRNNEKSEIYVSDAGGRIVLAKSESAVGDSLFESERRFPRIGEKIRAQGFRGTLDWRAPDGGRYLIVYEPISVGAREWVAQMKVPYSIVTDFIFAFYWRLSLLLAILVLIAALFVVAVVLAGRRIRRLERKICELEIEIDHERKAKAVKDIVDTKYFQELQAKAMELKESD